MRWLLQQGTRWLGSRLWDRARRAGQEQATQQSTEQLGTPATMAVVCESKRLFDAVADRFARPRAFEGDRFALTVGLLSGQAVVVARSLSSSPRLVSLMQALVDAHHPRFVLSVAEGASLRHDILPGIVVVATHIVTADGHKLRLDGRAPPATGYVAGIVASLGASPEAGEDPGSPAAADDWSEPVAQACQQLGLPLTAACAVFEPCDSQRSRGVTAIKKHSSRAAQAGVLAGMLWKQRSGLRDLWNANQSAWEACARTSRLAEYLVNASHED